MSEVKATGQGILRKMNVLMGAVGSISKDNRNTQQNYQFRSVEQVMNKLNPALQKTGVALNTTILDCSREKISRRKEDYESILLYSVIRLRLTFWDVEDGSSLSVEAVGEGMDNGDKASNKAMSAAFKYAVTLALCVPTEVVDPDTESPDANGDNAKELLKGLQGKYAKDLEGKPAKLIKDCFTAGTGFAAMYERSVKYLKTKGVWNG